LNAKRGGVRRKVSIYQFNLVASQFSSNLLLRTHRTKMPPTDPQENAYSGNPYQPVTPTSGSLSEPPIHSIERADSLRSLANWQTLFAVFGFLATGLMFLLAIMQVVILGLGRASLVGALLVGLLFCAITFFCYLIPSYLIFRAAQTARVAANSDLEAIAPFVQAQRSFWRYCGILGIIVFVLYLAFFVLMLLFGLSGTTLSGVSMP
jgi:hypothetical protein